MHELGLDYERRLIGPRTGETQTEEFLRLNPGGKIPVLQDGDLVLTESAAINNYLARTYANKQVLIPPDNCAQRAKYDQWCFFALTELDAQSLYIVHKHTTLARFYDQAPVAVEVAKQTFLRQCGVLDAALSDQRSWILGEDFCGADILLANCLAWGDGYQLPLTDTVRAYMKRTTSRNCYQDAIVASEA